jgi:hypothetical protein
MSPTELREEVTRVPTKPTDSTHITLSHTRIGDKSIADCVEALIGAYFTSGGPNAALIFMDAFGLRAPSETGTSVKFGDWTFPQPRREEDWIKTHSYRSLLPFIPDLEKLICYK